MTTTEVPVRPSAVEDPTSSGRRRWTAPQWLRTLAGSIGVILLLVLVWEGYKAFGQAVGNTWPGTDVRLPISTTDRSMPHIADIIRAMGEPATRGSDTSLIAFLLTETSVTLRASFYGLVAGGLVGSLFAVAVSQARLANKALMPWLIASQTVPLVAIAPMVVIWGSAIGLPTWVAVTIMAAYLAFFPVTVNLARGLTSAGSVQREVMLAAGAGRLRTLWMLHFPASLPYLFAGLRLAATAAVVGAIVGELSAGTGRGVGRSILTFAYYYTSGPEKLYAAVIIASVSGIIFVQALAIIEAIVLRHREKS